MAIRTLVLTVCTAGLGLWMLGPATEPALDPLISASVKSGDLDYTVSNMENGTACLITRGKRISARSREIMPGSDCQDVWPGLTAAHTWTQNDDGTVALTDSGGEAILTLGLGDGVDFESLEPANAVLAFNALN
ncbi:MAG: hypothetical protein JWM58_2144 [Rhizobium sp.]|nr:hypothetical protein [Rhizobium sp.]